MRKMTDTELLCADLIVSDPYASGGLTLERLPPGVTIVEAINIHEYRLYPHDRAYCCNCGGKRHKKGFRVKRSDGRQTLLGNCCAKPILVDSWTEMEACLRDLVERQRYLREIHALQPTLLRAQSLLASWSDLAKALRTARHRFRMSMSDVFELLQRACDRDGELMTSERVRRLKRGRGTGDDDGDEKEDFVWEHVPVRHVIRGREYLQRGDPADLPRRVQEGIELFTAVGENTDQNKTKHLKHVCSSLRKAVDEMRRLDRMRVAAAEFFTPTNLAGIVRWAHLLRTGHDRILPYDVDVRESALVNLSSGAVVRNPILPDPNPEIFELLNYKSGA